MRNATGAASLPTSPSELERLNALLAPYKEPSVGRSLLQIANTAIPFFSLLGLMYWAAFNRHWVTTFLLAIPTAGFLMRLFIIQHDCGHGSFFKSEAVSDLVGAFIGLWTLTPYTYWKKTHAIHHSTSGNLDRRGWGDIETKTVREYRAMTPWGRRWYRIYRSIPVLFFIGPAFHFVIYHRLPWIIPSDWKKERRSILYNDLALAFLLYTAYQTVGMGPFFAVQLSVGICAATAGVWFFYVQHQFEGTYWRKDESWDVVEASLRGSSYYHLPLPLQWITGNIGFHHIHHLNSRIPNYNLPKCMEENPDFQKVARLTLWQSFKCVKLSLWDEERGKMIGFADVRA